MAKMRNSIPQSSCKFDDVLIQIASFDDVEAIPMLFFHPECFDQWIRKSFKVTKMVNLTLWFLVTVGFQMLEHL